MRVKLETRVELETRVAAKAELGVEVHALLIGTLGQPLLLLPCAVRGH